MCLVWWFWICRCGLCSQSMNYKNARLSDDSVSESRLVSIAFFKQVSNLHRYSNSDTGLFSHLYKASSRIPWNRPGFPNFCTIDILSHTIFSWGRWIGLSDVSCLVASLSSIPLDANSPSPSCDNQKCLHTLLNVPVRGKKLAWSPVESHWNRQIQQQLMQTFEYSLYICLSIYHFQYSFHSFYSSRQNFQDVSVYLQFLSSILDALFFNNRLRRPKIKGTKGRMRWQWRVTGNLTQSELDCCLQETRIWNPQSLDPKSSFH